MVYVTPLAQYSNKYIFADMASLFHPFNSAVTLITDTQDLQFVTLNGVSIKGSSQKKVAGTEYKVITLFLPHEHPQTLFFEIQTLERSKTLGGLFYGHKLQEAHGMTIGQLMNNLDMECNSTVRWKDWVDNDCDGIIDEEIANG